MIPFTIGLIIGGLGGMAIMSCMAMAGRDDDGVLYICHQETVCPETTVCSFGHHDNETDRANANLIAAAPEMYEALRAVDAWENPSCFEKVEAALKKARGES